ncbi:hypothetical protein GLOIN_2v1873721 [Rhizophagus irregularis DAOM 181602=DAOM 197198]|uniref:Uncharacterized protein n=1 Tax=Rhizophagus irregularis (strain DAOM 181602 / DAOM 197198 / MUCL 43194) TaxID=747089 RepID=A0A2P4Q9G8_RHIID|nr:hypothetical protein GLOIN_2v1873721 [Rhizophagus irregularis DAOM 181602=DAOM 197198]POG74281.1 hypothetical protein GLOIN_2v1873721 [Rhizophagus irregularis DAOM 181602=DAOM 197198]|eukprot:XP_025181147.1 hypothetical protein GLOIN_2v1873721 [Rhizophagus irregularis DAOM 181602=DAOM 197198]
MSTEFSENGKSDSSDSSKNGPLEIDKLEARELAKHRLRQLTESNDEYRSLYDCFLQWHYLIVSVCGVVALFGITIAILKLMEKEILLDVFRLLQSSFASIISGGSIIALGSSYFFFDNDKDESKNEPKDEVIQLCMKGDLGEKLETTTMTLREKRNDLEQAMSWQSIWAIHASIVVLLLVGIDYFGLLPDIKYLDVGLDFLLSLTGIYYLFCLLESDETRIWTIIFYFFRPYASKDRNWIKEVYLSRDEKVEIAYLLRGLDPDISLLKVKKFNEELNENTPLQYNKKSVDDKSKSFIESVNDIEFNANQQIFEEYYNLGEALEKCLRGNVSPGYSQRPEYKEIIEKFSFIKSDVEKILNHYIDFYNSGSGLTLKKFFAKYPKQKHKNLSDEEIYVAHNALKVYCIFNKIDKGKIEKFKKFPAHSIGKFTRNEIFEIIVEVEKKKK